MKTVKNFIKKFDSVSIFRIYKYLIIESIIIARESGISGLIRIRGRKFILILAGYYMVRDTFLYIILPLLMIKGLL